MEGGGSGSDKKGAALHPSTTFRAHHTCPQTVFPLISYFVI
jgi:hypothetical protein